MGAALALLSLKESAQAAVPDLIAGSIDEENDTDLEIFPLTVRQAMLRALGTAAAGTAAAVPTLSAVLDGPAPDATWAISLRGLGLARRYAADTAPVVRALLRHPDADVRYAAEEALGRIGVDRAGPVRASEYDHLELPESERQRIWEIEHRVNVLNKFGFDPLSAALGHGNPAELTRFFAPAFNGTEPANPKRVNSAGFAHVERLESSGAASISLTTPQFVARLAGLRKEFGNDPKVKVVVATLHPKDLAVPDGMWEGRAQLRMAGESRPGAPAEVTATIDFEVLPPTEEGLMAGGWLRAAHLRQLATAQAPQSLFVEVAKARGLDTASLYDNWTADELVPSSGGVYVTDFDRDGYLDLLVTDLNSTTLYRGGPGGTFTNVTAAMGLPTTGSWSHKAAWADLDGDGWDDLILHERVYRNEGGVKFTDYTERCTPKLPKYRSSILVADYNRDGKLDLYITRTGRPGSMSWLQGRSNDTRGNVLLRNLGDWKFEDVTRKSGTRGGYGSAFTAAWFDADNDGWPDLFVPNEFGDGILFINNRDGTFKQHVLAEHPADFGTMGLAVGDVDNDGLIDIYCANMYSKAGTRVIGNLRPDASPTKVMEKLRRFVAGSQLHLNKGGMRFEHVGAQKQLASVGWAYGAVLADLDGDGFLDVYATAGYISRDRSKPDG